MRSCAASGFVGGTYADTPGVTPLTGAPTTEQNGVHTNFVSPVFFPQRLASVNYFGALDGNGTDGRTRLITTPVQYRSDPGSTTTDTERTYSHLGLQLFYSANTTTYGANTPALAAPPSISGVSDSSCPGGTAVTVSAHVTGDPSAGIQKAWVTYTAETGPLHGTWQSVDLVQDPTDSTLWTGTFALPSGQAASDVRYIVQAVNGVGLVGLDNNLGDGYTPGVPVGASTPPATTPTTVTLDAAARERHLRRQPSSGRDAPRCACGQRRHLLARQLLHRCQHRLGWSGDGDRAAPGCRRRLHPDSLVRRRRHTPRVVGRNSVQHHEGSDHADAFHRHAGHGATGNRHWSHCNADPNGHRHATAAADRFLHAHRPDNTVVTTTTDPQGQAQLGTLNLLDGRTRLPLASWGRRRPIHRPRPQPSGSVPTRRLRS